MSSCGYGAKVVSRKEWKEMVYKLKYNILLGVGFPNDVGTKLNRVVPGVTLDSHGCNHEDFSYSRAKNIERRMVDPTLALKYYAFLRKIGWDVDMPGKFVIAETLLRLMCKLGYDVLYGKDKVGSKEWIETLCLYQQNRCILSYICQPNVIYKGVDKGRAIKKVMEHPDWVNVDDPDVKEKLRKYINFGGEEYGCIYINSYAYQIWKEFGGEDEMDVRVGHAEGVYNYNSGLEQYNPNKLPVMRNEDEQVPWND